MGIRHFSGLFVLLCVGVTGALLTLAGEHAFYRLVLPHIRRRQKFKYWLHTSQKIHRALNMTYEDVKRQRANTEKSCNIQKAQPHPPPPPAALGSFARWNNESAKAVQEPKDNKRVHFNLETLNTRRLLPRVISEGGQASSASALSSGAGSLLARVCENGGPVQRPASSSVRSSSPSRENELEELQAKIEEIRGHLKAALARRAELQTTLAKERAAAVIAPVTTAAAPPTVTATICPALTKEPADLKR